MATNKVSYNGVVIKCVEIANWNCSNCLVTSSTLNQNHNMITALLVIAISIIVLILIGSIEHYRYKLKVEQTNYATLRKQLEDVLERNKVLTDQLTLKKSYSAFVLPPI